MGQKAEEHACNYLQKHGLRLQQRNYACRLGEIDLIMRDKEQLVFVEVRYRKNNNYGSAAASIGNTKQIKIIRTASYYLASIKQYDKIPCRFDVIAISAENHKPTISWIKNAF